MSVARWVLLLPVSILALMLGSLLGGIVLSVFGQDAANVGSGFFGSFAFVFMGCAIAPAKRPRVGRVMASVVAILALGTVFLSRFSAIPEFNGLTDVEKTVVPVFQVIGAIYAMFIALPVIYKSATAEDFGRELAGASSTVIILGLLVVAVGVLSALFGASWLAAVAGIIAVGVGALTWVAAPISALLLSRPRIG